MQSHDKVKDPRQWCLPMVEFLNNIEPKNKRAP